MVNAKLSSGKHGGMRLAALLLSFLPSLFQPLFLPPLSLYPFSTSLLHKRSVVLLCEWEGQRASAAGQADSQCSTRSQLFLSHGLYHIIQSNIAADICFSAF